MITICNADEWFSAKVNTYKKIDYVSLIEQYNSSCQIYNVVGSQIYKPFMSNSPFLLIESNVKNNDKHQWKNFPNLINNIKCYNFKSPNNLNTYVVIPFDGARFGIIENTDWKSKLINSRKLNTFIDPLHNGFNIGIYKESVEWLKHINKSEMWTDSSCLLIKENIWNNIKHKLKH